jgi:ribosome-associated protein
MLIISPAIRIPFHEIVFEYTRASGPGGQHVNKTSTAVQLRFHIAHSPSLPEEVKRRLIQLGGGRVTTGGEMIITARRFRSQEANRRDALDRLRSFISRAARPARIRRSTAVPKASRRLRLTAKRMRGQIKKLRAKAGAEE